MQEYWLFDPRGEWVVGQLLGYRLLGDVYAVIRDNRCQPLGLRVQVEGELLAFYREDTGEKLLVPGEMVEELQRTAAALEQECWARERAEQRVAALSERLRSLGVDLPEDCEALHKRSTDLVEQTQGCGTG